MIFICRHWETIWNKEHRQQWLMDSPLTEKWQKHAEELWKELSKFSKDINQIISSPIKRAFDTANIANQIIKVKDISTCDLLKERNFGIFEWKTRIERHSEPLISIKQERETKDLLWKFNWKYPEWESYQDVEIRVKEFLQLLDKNLNYVIVAHERGY